MRSNESNSNLPIIHGSIVSPYVRKVLLTLNFKKIPYQLKPLNPFADADKKFLLTLNPLGKVPVYQEGDFTLADSSVICAYLEKTHATPAIYPSNPNDYARSLWLEELADTQLIPLLASIFLNTVMARLFKKPVDQIAVDNALKKLPAIFDYLNNEIRGEKFLINDQLSIADISIGQLALINYDILDIKIDITKWKRLAAYVDYICGVDLFNDLFVQGRERLKGVK